MHCLYRCVFHLALLTRNIRHTFPSPLAACHCPRFLPRLPCCASARPVWTLRVRCVSCSIASAVSDQGSSGYSEEEPTPDATAPGRLSRGTRSPLDPLVGSFPSHGLPACSASRTRTGWGRGVCSAWSGACAKVAARNPAAPRADTSMLCLRGKKTRTPPEYSGFPSSSF